MSEVRTEELIPLDRIATESEVVILPDFPALLEGQRVWVTAVLERTAVIEPSPGEPKVLVNRQRCLVNPSDIRFGHIAARYAARRGREAARRNREAAQSARRPAA
jgi:hypothetical protein